MQEQATAPSVGAQTRAIENDGKEAPKIPVQIRDGSTSRIKGKPGQYTLGENDILVNDVSTTQIRRILGDDIADQIKSHLDKNSMVDYNGHECETN